jgi:hypothetical protein
MNMILIVPYFLIASEADSLHLTIQPGDYRQGLHSENSSATLCPLPYQQRSCTMPLLHESPVPGGGHFA